jgi:uncharacterized protein (UPF0261 family)
MPGTIALLGAFDTKGLEYQFIRDCIESRGFRTFLIDFGTLPPVKVQPDVTNREVAAAVGADLDILNQKNDRRQTVSIMSQGVESLVPRLFSEGRFDGILALGDTGETSLACRAMRTLPYRVPKVMVSIVAGTDVSGYVGVRDIVMIPSIVDVAGVNRISREVFARAAGAVCGMVDTIPPEGDDKPLIVASTFGNTTKAVNLARAILETVGYEVLVFHCTGTGGRTLESLVESGVIDGVFDLTTTEWADELVGGVLNAGPTRLEAAARKGVPAIVTPGCLDMVNFWAPETIPDRFRHRLFYRQNPNITLMRTTVEENHKLGGILAEKVNLSTGPVTVLFPQKGFSMIDSPGGPFWLPEADQALLVSLKERLRPDIPLIEMDCNINDPEFSRCCANTLLENMRLAGKR